MTATQPPRPNPWSWIGWIVLAAVLLLAGVWFGNRMFSLNPPVSGLRAATLLPVPRPLAPFHLQDQNEQPLTQASFQGHWSLVTFGYTLCPDVCPTTLATLTAVGRLLDQRGLKNRVRFVFVTLDPERDSSVRLKEYLAYFGPDFMGGRGPEAALRDLTGQLGIAYAKVEDSGSALGYLLDHSTGLLLIDPQARLRALFSAPHDAPAIAGDLALLTQP